MKEPMTERERRMNEGNRAVEHAPASVNKCHAKSLTRSTSVVKSVIICALLEKSPSSSSFFSASMPSPAATAVSFLDTSLRMSVLVKRIDPSRLLTGFLTGDFAGFFEGDVGDEGVALGRTWIVVVEIDHSWPVTVRPSRAISTAKHKPTKKEKEQKKRYTHADARPEST